MNKQTSAKAIPEPKPHRFQMRTYDDELAQVIRERAERQNRSHAFVLEELAKRGAALSDNAAAA